MMILKRFLRALTGAPQPAAPAPQAAAPSAPAATALAGFAPPVYPPIDQGFPALNIDELLAPHGPLLQRLRDLAGADPDFEQRYIKPIRKLAAWIHLLPSTPSTTYAEPGGALRFALELGVHSLQAAHGRLFTGNEGVESRHANEPRWRYACFLAGLAAELGRPVADTVVTDENGDRWGSFAEPLGDWLERGHRQRYFVNWVDRHDGGASVLRTEPALIVSQLVDVDTWAWLDDGSREITRAIYACASGQARPSDSIVADVVATLRAKLIARDDAQRNNRYGKVIVGAHLEPHLLDAMRSLVDSGAWEINAPGAQLWFGIDGLFLVWPRYAKDIIGELEKRGLPGVPRSSTTLADILLAAGVVTVSEPANPIWAVRVPTVRRVEGTSLVEHRVEAALRFENPLALLSNMDVTPSVERIAVNDAPVVHQPVSGARTATDAAIPASATPPASEAAPAKPKVKPTKAAAAAKSGELFDGDAEGAAKAIPMDVRATLKDAHAEVFGAWVETYNAAARPDALTTTPEGVGVCAEFASRYGLDLDSIVDELNRRQWIFKTGAGGGKYMRLKFGAETKRAFVIATDAARALGFKVPA